MNVKMQLKSGSQQQSAVTMLLLLMMMMTVPAVLGHSAARYQVGLF